MRNSRVIAGVAASAAIVGLILAITDRRMLSRDLGCASEPSGRAQAICGALSRSLEWTWTGHAVVAPGWRPTWAGLRRVYCGASITPADLPALESMKNAADWRLRDSAGDLIRLVHAGAGEPENSVFNPAHPEYVLKRGCGAE